MDEEESTREIDRWVTNLVDLIPTTIYIPTATDKNQTEKLSKVEKRRRRLDPETCLTTSMKALMTIDDSPETTTDTDRSDLRPSELKERFAAKMAEIRANQKRDLPKTPRTAEEQAVVSARRKAERERMKKKKNKLRSIKDDAAKAGGKSPVKEVKEENGKIIFNKFDLIKDPIEAEKERTKKKKPLQIRLKEAEAREAKIEDLEETNPEKAEALKEKKKWKDATTRVMGEKVRDDANLLKKSLKRQEQKKAASKKKWDDRTQKLNDKIQAKQDKRKANIKARSQQKKDKKIKKRIGVPKGKGQKQPGF